MVDFSRRLPEDLRPNRLAAAGERYGPARYDLTVSNPTLCGLPYPGDLLHGLGDEGALRYRPDPKGPEEARRAIAGQYASWGADVDPDRLVLTASTSEAYGMLFRLLADPGDSILVPTPSYPLFEQLARLDAVELTRYRLDPESEWRIARESLAPVDDRCRAVAAVHPNNPTGSHVHPADADTLAALCRDRRMALIADEVFLPYCFEYEAGPTTFASRSDCLGFTLGGLSKWVGLPQLKLAWIVVGGPDRDAADALERLEHIADAYLSVSTPVAMATPGILESGRSIRHSIAARCRDNVLALCSLAAGTPSVDLCRPAGGWSAVLRYPAVVDEESLVLRLLTERGVAVHPGFFYDFPTDGWLVLSLLPPPDIFREGITRLLELIADLVGDGG
jgi:aspartate/methionine/tyrosine aminotransferase